MGGKYNFKGELALAVTTLLWGGTFVLVSKALKGNSAFVFLSIRFVIASILFLPFVVKEFKKALKYELITGTILALIYFFSFATQTIGLQYTTATKSAFITGSFIIFTPLLQLVIEKKIPTIGNLLGIILVVLGLIILSAKQVSLSAFFSNIGGDFNIGDALTLVCAFLYALYIVYLDIISKKTKNFNLLIFMQLSITALCSLIALAITPLAGINNVFTLTADLITAVIYCSLFATVITTYLQTRYQRMVSPTEAGIIFSFEPIFASILAIILLNEKITNFTIFGGLCIFAGLIISETIDKYITKYAKG